MSIMLTLAFGFQSLSAIGGNPGVINFSEQGSRNCQNKNLQCVCVRCGEGGGLALMSLW